MHIGANKTINFKYGLVESEVAENERGNELGAVVDNSDPFHK